MANGTWKIARSRGHAQLPLTIVAALAIVIVLLGKAQSTLFDRARAHVADWVAPVLVTVRAPLAGLDRFMGSIGEIFTVYEQNLKLKDENARLRQWRSAAIVLDERVKRYQLLLHAVPDPELSTVLAQVIGRSSRPFQQTMILDAGHANGVKPGQAVVDSRGMIGRIYIAGQHTSWVILLTDLNSRIPVTIEPGNIQAIMAGDNSSSPSIEVSSWNAHLKGGEQVVSSGDGSLLPPGLAVGTVSGSDGAWRVSLLADPAASQDVNVLDYKRPVEDLPSLTPGDLPATAAGLAPAQPAPQTAPPAPVLMPMPPPNATAAQSPPANTTAKPTSARVTAAAAPQAPASPHGSSAPAAGTHHANAPANPGASPTDTPGTSTDEDTNQ
jgi:rod shape-determining protein MreC